MKPVSPARKTALQHAPASWEIPGLYRVDLKIWHHFYFLTLPYINRFSQLFRRQNQEEICNNTVAKDPITPHVCLYTTL